MGGVSIEYDDGLSCRLCWWSAQTRLQELSDAQWFDVTSLPVAPVGTIMRQLIEKTVDDVMKVGATEKTLSRRSIGL